MTDKRKYVEMVRIMNEIRGEIINANLMQTANEELSECESQMTAKEIIDAIRLACEHPYEIGDITPLTIDSKK